MYTLWAYIIATIGIICGIFVLKECKWKLGTWIICISLSVFAGGNIQIENLVSNTLNITERLRGIESDIQNLQVDVKQTVALKQEMSQTVSVIMEVKKEIANINEAIAQYYEREKFEKFTQKDLGQKVRVFDSGTSRVVYFQLKKIPIFKSVSVSDGKGMKSFSTHSSTSNILFFRTKENLERILTGENDFYYIQYKQEPEFSDKPLYTVEGMKYKGTEDDPTYAWFPLLISDKESNLTGQSSTND